MRYLTLNAFDQSLFSLSCFILLILMRNWKLTPTLIAELTNLHNVQFRLLIMHHAARWRTYFCTIRAL